MLDYNNDLHDVIFRIRESGERELRLIEIIEKQRELIKKIDELLTRLTDE